MKVLEIRETSIVVTAYPYNDVENFTLVEKLTDEGGVYFLDQNLEKKYIVIEPSPKKATRESKLEDFKFNVEYQNKRRDIGWSQKNTTIKAKNFEDAVTKLHKNFKVIFEYSEI